MGIKSLSQVIGDHASDSMKENTLKNYFGRKIAIDASMSMYQFLIAVRQAGDGNMLTNDVGETTSHLQGMFYRTAKMINNGMKPVFVFDGKAPVLKSGELAKRSARKREAEKELAEAKETGEAEDIAKFAKRSVRVTKVHNDECKRLLQLMGVPIVEAPCEAEAQCAAMVRAGICYATGTEDMDALTLGSPLVIRHLTFSESRKIPIKEIYLDKVLAGLGFTMEQFIDMCILLGCDYCETIRGIGPKKAYEFIAQYKSIENLLQHLDQTKYPIPSDWPFSEVRDLFKNPLVADPASFDLKWAEPDEEGLKKFLVEEKQFNEERVLATIAKLKKSKTTSVQGRLDAFFGPATTTTSTPTKRKREEEEERAGKRHKGNEKEKGGKGKGKTATPSKGKAGARGRGR